MLKKTVLELGGSDPYLLLEDADIELAAAVSTKARLGNSGQSCIAGKRFIVVDKVRRAFEARFVERMGAVKMGDHWTRIPRSGRWRGGICATRCISRSRVAPPRVRACCSEARSEHARRLLSAHGADRRSQRNAGL